MPTVNMSEAKSTLSRLVAALESGRETEIIIARNGRPAAKIVPIQEPSAKTKRIGVAAGHFRLPDSIDTQNELVSQLFGGPSN